MTSRNDSPFSNRRLWTPTPQQIAESRLSEFRALAEERSGRSLPDYSALHQWSIDEREDFWTAIWDDCGVRAETRGDRILLDDRMPGSRWFPDARLNFAENLLHSGGSELALICYDERGKRSEWSFDDLQRESARLAFLLRARGAEPGDRLAAFVPNGPHAIIGMLAAASCGVIWSSCSPDFGTPGVLDRFQQIEPRWILCTDGYHYGGKTFDSLERVKELVAGLPSIEECWVFPNLDREPEALRSEVSLIQRSTLLADALESVAPADAPLALEFEALPFDHPLYIVYSSGTTGRPKCIIHGAGGTLLQHLKEHQLHCNLRPGDRLFYFTTCGWMMWNWLASGLASRVTLVLYDGSPSFPDANTLFDLIDREQITVFGVSAKYIDSVAKTGITPKQSHTLSSLRSILSTGSPLAPASFEAVYDLIKTDVHLASISGGTDILSCFVGGVPTLPVHRGEIQSPMLGMAIDVYDDLGQTQTNLPGELVCTRSFPSMPIGFWGDPENARFHSAYFERYPGIWHHGDWLRRSDHGGYVIDGRSDAVLNPGGVRIGTAEIYRVVERMEEITESLAIGQEWEDDVRVVLFIVLSDGFSLDDALVQRIRQQVRENASPRHMPARVITVPMLPRTHSGKITELAVREIVHGRPVRNLGALANPDSLAHFGNRSELEN